jgi:hypothetical protein
MTLVILTVVVIGLLIAVLAIYLFAIGVQLSRTAENLGDCLQNVRTIAGQTQVIGPGVTRLNKVGTDLLGAMPLLIEGADAVTAKLIPSSATQTAPQATASVGYMDAESVAARSTPPPADRATPLATTGVGYMDV